MIVSSLRTIGKQDCHPWEAGGKEEGFSVRIQRRKAAFDSGITRQQWKRLLGRVRHHLPGLVLHGAGVGAAWMR